MRRSRLLFCFWILICLCVLPKKIFGQAVRFDSVSSTTSAQCASGKICPINAIPGTTVALCSPQSSYTACIAAPATTYTSASASQSCPQNSPLTPATGGSCLATSDNQGGFGFWTTPGSYTYFLVVPRTAGGGTYGPYPITIGGSQGCPIDATCDANYPTLALACSAAGVGTLYVTKAWNGTPTQTLACQLQFLGGGKIQPASGATVTMKCPSAGQFQVFDISLSTEIAFSSACASAPPVTWWGVSTAASDNSTAVNAALATANTVYVPAGSYTFTNFVQITQSSQSITCDPNATWTYNGTSSAVYIHSPSSAEIDFAAVQGCTFTTPNSGAVYGINSDASTNKELIDHNTFTTSGSGSWTGAGVRIVNGETSTVSFNRFIGIFTAGILLGDGVSNGTTSITVTHNVVGACGPGCIGLELLDAKTIVSDNNYYQDVGFTYCYSINASSQLTIVGDTCENDNTAATYGVYNQGVLKIVSLTGTGLFPIFLYNENTNAVASVTHLDFNGDATSWIVEGSGGVLTLADSPRLINTDTSTGGGVFVDGTRAQIGPGVNVTLRTGNTGNAFSVDSAAVLHGVTANIPTASTGFGLSCAANQTQIGIYIRDFDFENGAGSTSTQFFSSGCPGHIKEAAGLVYNGNFTIPDIVMPTSIAASGSNQTIAPETSLVSISGSGTIQTITPPPGGDNCLSIVVAAGSTWSFTSGGNLFNGPFTPHPGTTFQICSRAGTYFTQLQNLYSCGSSASCASPTQIPGNPFIYSGTIAFSSATTATVSGLGEFTSSTTFSCIASDPSNAYTWTTQNLSGSSFKITAGTSNSDTWTWVCTGY